MKSYFQSTWGDKIIHDVIGNRLLPESIIPLAGQFRYVTFNIDETKNIDFMFVVRSHNKLGYDATVALLMQVVSAWEN